MLFRYGQSMWNQKNCSTGWTDVALSAEDWGRRAGLLLRANKRGRRG